jgi:prophage regulatory protein
MSRISIDEARALASKWKAHHEDHIREVDVQARFSGVSASDLLEMWEQRTNERGKRLTKLEAEALACALTSAFGCVPGAVAGEKAESKSLPPDDSMLRMSEVIRLTGISESSIKRLIEAGLFPKPIKLMPRRNGWQARDVKKWLDERDALGTRERRH